VHVLAATLNWRSDNQPHWPACPALHAALGLPADSDHRLGICNGLCTDQSTDSNNCYYCGNKCPSNGGFCSDGSCKCDPVGEPL